jgi:hypothetical protein
MTSWRSWIKRGERSQSMLSERGDADAYVINCMKGSLHEKEED